MALPIENTSKILVPSYVATMLLSSGLLFLVQPMFARMALPLLGGTPAVWAIAMCFFQAVLLGGYCYAHALKRFLNPSHAILLHLCLMALSWFSLPVHLEVSSIPTEGATAGLWLIGLMAKSIGYPFFFLSATAPLLQSWFARTTHRDAGNPYFLYSASNIGSLGSLVAYPFVVEPFLGLKMQALYWSFGFTILVIAIGLCGLIMLRTLAPARIVGFAETSTATTWKQRGWWIFMAFIPSALLVAWTNHITTDIASAPFLWLPPLMLFLLTFVLVFRDQPLIPMKLARVLQLISLPAAYAIQFAMPLNWTIGVIILGAISFFTTALICHRQLYEARPDASRLTEFYMLMSLGGVLGGLFVSLIAPLIFTSVLEYPLLLILGIAAHQDLLSDQKLRSQLQRPWVLTAIFVALALIIGFANQKTGNLIMFSQRTLEIAFFGACTFLMIRAGRTGLAALSIVMVLALNFTVQPPARLAMRSYFGVLTVADADAENPYRLLYHGTTLHGAERLSELKPDYKDKPHGLTYYSAEGGMARSLVSTQDRLAAQSKTGTYQVIGLGTGSLSCYARPGEDWAYYEIDRDVIKVAQDPKQFTFLSTCAPNMKMIEGDARITMQTGEATKADYLLVDAFSSDSIPVHLITTEAMQLYLQHVQDDGVLVIHISNRYMDLAPVVAANIAAIDPNLKGLILETNPPKAGDVAFAHSIVIAISQSYETLNLIDKTGGSKPLKAMAGVEPWTDDFANLPSAMLRRIRQTK
jgi:preprotein translocase subunit SecG